MTIGLSLRMSHIASIRVKIITIQQTTFTVGIHMYFIEKVVASERFDGLMSLKP